MRKKIHVNDEPKQHFQDEKDDEWGCFDKEFKMQKIMIESKRKKFPRFSKRFQPTSNKFTIDNVSNEQKNEHSTVEVEKNAFTTGFCLFYWPHFGTKTAETRTQIRTNRNDYGGYSPFDLFIAKGKYSSLKDEILNNNDNEVGINEYDFIIFKAKQYMVTDVVKKNEMQ
eukprot:425472_1